MDIQANNGCGEKVASFLKEMGVEKGDRIIVSLPNTPHYFIIASAIFKMGGILVQSNPIYTERELRHIVKNSEARMMFAIDLTYNNYRALVEEGLFDKVVIARIEDFLRFPLNILFKAFVKKEEIRGNKDRKTSEITDWGKIMRYPKIEKEVEIDPWKTLRFCSTGGTTGLPKGAMLTHFNLVANAYQVASWDVKASEKMSISVPCLYSTATDLPWQTLDSCLEERLYRYQTQGISTSI